jgi:branched-chain amino acid transport system permease protein
MAKGAAAGTFVLAVALVPLALADYQAYEFALVGTYFVAICGLNILTGYTGQISLGHGAFMAVGGYTTAILATDHGIDPVWTIPIGGLVAGLAGFAFGIPALRLSGLYLALVTFGVAVAVPALARWEKVDQWTGGSTGKNVPLPQAHWGLHLTPNDWLYYQNWTVALVLLLVAWLLLRGRTGRAFRAVRDSEVAATSFGVHLPTYKTLAFGVSAFYAGVAGSLFAITVAYVNPDTYPIKLSVYLVVGVVAAGLGSLWGLVFGAALIEYLPVKTPDIVDWINSVLRTDLDAKATGISDFVFGTVLILVMLLLPTGAAGLLKRLWVSAARLYTRPRVQ